MKRTILVSLVATLLSSNLYAAPYVGSNAAAANDSITSTKAPPPSGPITDDPTPGSRHGIDFP